MFIIKRRDKDKQQSAYGQKNGLIKIWNINTLCIICIHIHIYIYIMLQYSPKYWIRVSFISIFISHFGHDLYCGDSGWLATLSLCSQDICYCYIHKATLCGFNRLTTAGCLIKMHEIFNCWANTLPMLATACVFSLQSRDNSDYMQRHQLLNVILWKLSSLFCNAAHKHI